MDGNCQLDTDMAENKNKIRIQKFDDLFQYVGGLGAYQISHIFILCKFQYLHLR